MSSLTSLAHERLSRMREKLVRELGELVCGCLDDNSVVEIMLNPDGVLWVEHAGRDMVRLGEMPHSRAEAAISTIAAFHKTTIGRDNPILECELPLDGSRFEGLVPPVVSAPCFAIRRKPATIFSLEKYVESGVMSERQYTLITLAIEEHRNILIVGGTGSGKTTLANAMIAHMARVAVNDRLVILEDTAEIQCASPNAVLLRSSDQVSLRQLVRATLRLRPDRILIGEVRGGESLDLLKAWNTGHPGGIATIHANDALSGLIRLENLIAEVSAAPMQRTIAVTINLIVFISRTSTGRKIQEVVRVQGFDGGRYITQTLQEGQA